MNEIRDIALAPSGETKIAWVRRNMPVLRGIEADFAREKPFAGMKIALSVHLEAKTAYLCRVLAAGGAEMYVTGSNPLSTQDDVAAALAAGGMEVHAVYGASEEEYFGHIKNVLSHGPNIVIDDGGDLLEAMRTDFPELCRDVIGGCEETTSGIHRIRKLAKDGQLPFTMVEVNDADCKHLFDNRYGTGQSVWDAIMRTTNLIVAGKVVVVSGYGWCGKGVALRAKGLGAKVVVTETDPIRAIEAVMDGYEVMPMRDAARIGEIFCSVTGCKDVMGAEHFALMRDGAILSNAGHFNVEIDMEALEKMAVRKYTARHNITAYVMPDGRELFVLGEGRLVNLACGDGHPAEIMDMSFAIQALSAEYLAKNAGKLPCAPLTVPREIDEAVARRKLASLGVEIDTMTTEQKDYMGI
ncbi:MAG TPA: adenosylhomocysteinase [Candidatus Scatomorpha pullicola]|nr:adenosylhomocysteinase [Candidatus Scatomorpha pullicola]